MVLSNRSEGVIGKKKLIHFRAHVFWYTGGRAEGLNSAILSVQSKWSCFGQTNPNCDEFDCFNLWFLFQNPHTKMIWLWYVCTILHWSRLQQTFTVKIQKVHHQKMLHLEKCTRQEIIVDRFVSLRKSWKLIDFFPYIFQNCVFSGNLLYSPAIRVSPYKWGDSTPVIKVYPTPLVRVCP